MVKPLNDFAATFGSSIVDSGAIYLILGIAVVAMAAAGVRAGFTLRRFTMMFVALAVFGDGDGVDERPGQWGHLRAGDLFSCLDGPGGLRWVLGDLRRAGHPGL